MPTSKKPEWVKISKEDLEKIVIDLAKNGESTSKIGLILRDKHGIPKSKLVGTKISKILEKNKIKVKTDKESLDEKLSILKNHISKHKKDHNAQRSLSKKLWVMNKFQ